MQVLDIVILLGLALPALVGAAYGFLNILFSITAWVLALGIAIQAGPLLAPLLERWVDTPLLRDGLAFAAAFIVCLLLFSALGYLVVKLLGRTGLTAADRMLGFFFGLGLGGAIIAVLVFLAGFTALPQEPWWRSSLLAAPFENIALASHRYLPENMTNYHGYRRPASPPKPQETL
jgi:membrane protein required for colicin V production